MEKISLKDWEVFSQRYNSTNYMDKSKKWMLKTSSVNKNIDIKEFEVECEIAKGATAMGIPTPEVKGIVEIEEGGIGIVFEYIEGKKSICRTIAEDESVLEKNMKIFSDMGKYIHSLPCDIKKYTSIEEKIFKYLDGSKLFDNNEKNAIRKFVDKVEKTSTCLHVDYQFSNVIVSSKGNYFIDLGLLSYGNPMYDVGLWYLFTHYNHKDVMSEHFFHMSYERLLKCWNAFVKYYFGVEDENEKNKLEESIKPFAILSFFPHCAINDLEEFLVPVKELWFNDAFKEYL